MNKRRDPQDLGPLPKADRNAELQRLSIAAFQSSLPTDKFVFRGEPVEDAGVDGSLELIVDGSYTNLRAQVQLKSTDSEHTNSDGSVSVQVRASNLNYLLHGQSPIYVLYISPRGELRFAWARDERKRLDESNPDWAEQEYITIRFHAFVTPSSLAQIYDRIRQEARLQREVINRLDVASSTGQVVVSINPETLNVTDPEEVKSILINSGTAIVSAGYSSQVKDLIRVLDPRDAQSPRILLVQAHAESYLGRYQFAIALLAEASLHLDELSDEDQFFLQTLQDMCDFQTGRISTSEFSQRLDQRAQNGNSRFALSDRLERLRYALNSERDLARRAHLLEELKHFVEGIVDSPDNSEAFKIHARICWIESAGNQFVLDSLREIGESRLKLAVNRVPDFKGMFQAQAERLARWDEESISVLRGAAELGNPFLVAGAMVARGNICYGVLTNQKTLSLLFGFPNALSQHFIQDNIDNALRAAGLFSQSGNLEGELRAKILIADFHDLIDCQSKAQEIAGEVLPKAKFIGYSDLIWRADKHLSGQSLQSELADAVRPRSEKEKADDNAQMSDKELSQYAAEMLRTLNLPEERLPVMEREYSSYRDIARERLNWCGQIELIQDKRHELLPATHYRTDPTRFCLCRLHGYRSKFGHSDWEGIISAFKKSYCEGCMDRAPLNESSG